MWRRIYNFFLLVGLAVFVMSTDGTKVCAKQQESEPVIVEPGISESSQALEVSLFPDNFQSVLFIGDSRTVGLYEYGRIGEADVFAKNGMTVFMLWDSQLSFHDKGKKSLEQVLTEKQYQVIHVMLGINELGYPMDQIVEKYRGTVEKIQAMQPDAKVILGANLHVTAENSTENKMCNNERINELNFEIQKIGDELGCQYINANEIFDDAQGNLSKDCSTDGIHMRGKYYSDWVRWISGSK